MQKHVGISVDIGTSTICAHLIDTDSKQVVLEQSVRNPQNRYGLDVVSRIEFALETTLNRSLLTNILHAAVSSLIAEMLYSQSIEPEGVKTVVIVGNTVMHHFYYGLPLAPLIEPPYDSKHHSPMLTNEGTISVLDGRSIKFYTPPIVHSFIGPDLLANFLSSGTLDSDKIALLIDIGTNTEILLKVHGHYFCSSAPSGPAFEGMALDCGMLAETGAIDYVHEDMRPPEVHVIGDVSPKGICGSGAVSSLSYLLKHDFMDTNGSLCRNDDSGLIYSVDGVKRFCLVDATYSETKKPIHLSQIDIRMLQNSKAAIRAAIEVLMDCADVSGQDIEYVYLTGAFGSSLQMEDAFAIGLFPSFQNAVIDQVRNGAVLGADMMITEPSSISVVEGLVSKIQYIELMDNADYDLLLSGARFFSPEIQ